MKSMDYLSKYDRKEIKDKLGAVAYAFDRCDAHTFFSMRNSLEHLLEDIHDKNLYHNKYGLSVEDRRALDHFLENTKQWLERDLGARAWNNRCSCMPSNDAKDFKRREWFTNIVEG